MSRISTTKNGEYKQFVLVNSNGISVTATNFGGIIQSIVVPDRTGVLADIALGFEDIQSYIGLKNRPYFGAVIGRYCNRISKGQFEIDEMTFQLATNNDSNHLHGGNVGFDQVSWESNATEGQSFAELSLQYVSTDMEEGYPGNLTTTVTYRLTDQNQLCVSFNASTDRATHINLTQHTYFNLKGEGVGNILDHEVILNANRYTPIDETSIPTGEIATVADTPFDFRSRKSIGSDITSENSQLHIGKGYDHNFVIDGPSGELRLAASIYEPESGRRLDVFTDEPGMQFYTGNFLDGTLIGKSGIPYERHSGFCIETQHFPDSPNQKNFPSTLLRPGKEYQSKTVFEFSTDEP